MTKSFQQVIDNAGEANSKAFRASAALDKFCLTRYGHTPSDIDCDSIIDTVLGGAGEAEGLPAYEFDQAMIDAAEMAGVELKPFRRASRSK